MLPTFEQDEAAKRALKFFVENPPSQKEKTGLYYDALSNRMFVNLFLISDTNHKKPWKVNGDYIPDWIPTARETPIVLFKKDNGHFDHPLIKNASIDANSLFQESKAVGRCRREFPDPFNPGSWRGLGEITISKVKQFLKELNIKEVPIYSSPQIHYPATEDDYDIKKAVYMHSALTDMPSFPPEVSRIRAVCEGDAVSCYQKIANASVQRFEAGESGHHCFVDAIKEILYKAKAKGNTYLKIEKGEKQSVKEMSDQKYATGSDESNNNNSTNQNQQGKPDNSAVKVVDLETAKTLTKDFVEEAFNRRQKQLNEAADPVGTFNKSYGIDSNNNNKNKKGSEQEPDETNENDNEKPDENPSQKLDPKTQAVIDKLVSANKELQHKERIAAIKDVIPLELVLDHKTNSIDPALLKEQIELMDKSSLSIEEIAKHYKGQMKRLEILVQTNTRRTAKASMSNDELASYVQERQVKFDAPNKIGNASTTGTGDDDEEVIKNASLGGNNNLNPLWYLEFADAVVTPVTNKEDPKVMGSPRRMI
jgi:hypothetical protein